MKGIITTEIDRYRLPYGRLSQDFPRRCVFAMTTNQTEYLKDETGNRRWLPVTVIFKKADVQWIAENREQLFAEAYHRVVILKENAHEFPEEATVKEQNARRIKDANTDSIIEWYYSNLSDFQRESGITIYQVYRDVIYEGHVTKPLDKYHEMNIAEVLRSALNLEKRKTLDGEKQQIRWYAQGTGVLSELSKFENVDNW